MTVVDLTPKADQAAFTSLYREHYRSVHGYVRSAYRSYDADDVAAAVFTIVWDRFYEIPEGNEKAWLFGVVRNVLRNEMRNRQRRVRLVGAVILNRPTTSIGQHDEVVPCEVSDEIMAGFGRLSNADREILLLAAWAGLSAGEIAVTLGIEKNAATVRLHRARQRLRDAMGRADSQGGHGHGAA